MRKGEPDLPWPHLSQNHVARQRKSMKITRIQQMEGNKKISRPSFIVHPSRLIKETKLDDQFIQRALHDPSEPAEDGLN